MKQWIRWWGIGAFTAIAVIFWLSIDSVISYSIETAGTQAVGAKVEVSSSDLSLFPLGLSVYGLAITNPKQPMENLWLSDKITLQLNTSHLFRRQVIVEQAQVTGLQFNAPRQHSGAIDDSANKPQQTSAIGKKISDSLPDPKALLEQEKAAITAKFKAIEDELKAIERQWDTRLDTLPDKETLGQYKQRWKALKKKNWLEKINDTKALQKDIKKDLATISDLEKQFTIDKNRVNQLLKQAKNLPEQEADRLLAQAGYSGGSRELAQKLFGSQAKQRLNKMTGLFQAVSSDDALQESTAQRGKGQWVQFKEDNPHPDLLIKQATLAGYFNVLGETINFTGNAQHLTHQPKRWQHPAQFKLSGSSQTGAQFFSQGRIDLRQQPLSEMTVQFKQLAIKNVVLSASDTQPISLASATLNGGGELKLNGDNIHLTADSHFVDSLFNTTLENPNASTTEKLIAATLAGIKKFNLTLSMSGDINNPDLSVKSDLDKALASSLKNQAAGELNSYKNQLSQGVKHQLADKMEGLNKEADFMGDIKQQLGDKKSALKGFSKGLF
ncbi:MAG: hypothetical protein ACJA0N_002413 [Pseudohongiellaceae bacterium]|jgi:uncharacterized protein (TIGR03545 family)